MPDLEDMDGLLDGSCMSLLGETIGFKPKAGTWDQFKADVDYGEVERDAGSGTVIDSDITVSVLKTDVPVRPDGATVTLPKIRGVEFTVRNSKDMGSEWQFWVKRNG